MHSPEPWHVMHPESGPVLRDATGHWPAEQLDANLERAVACVNACRFIADVRTISERSMMPDHSPEPWTYDSNSGIVYDSNHNGIATEVYEDDANRIVACVNACKNIPVDILQAIAHGQGTLTGSVTYLVNPGKVEADVQLAKGIADVACGKPVPEPESHEDGKR